MSEFARVSRPASRMYMREGNCEGHREESQLALRGHVRRPSTACGTKGSQAPLMRYGSGSEALGGARAVEPSVSRNRT
jgi:hypothetical protein